MSDDRIKRFREEREALNEIILEKADLVTKRFFNLDTQTYKDGALPSKVKEMLGLVASAVLRCDDCILYHLIQCRDQGITDDELSEILSIALVVGGSITIPHIRRAYRAWEDLKEETS